MPRGLPAGLRVVEAKLRWPRVADAERANARAGAVASNALTRAESDGMIKTANAKFDVARTTAVGHYNVEKEKFDALTGVVEDACISTADATFAASELPQSPLATLPSWPRNFTSDVCRSRTDRRQAMTC